MTSVRTHYDQLKVARDAPAEVIRAAYKTLSQKYHPDRNPGDADAARIMQILNSAYEVLSDPAKRAAHDAWIRRAEAPAATRPSPPAPPPRERDTSPPAAGGASGVVKDLGKGLWDLVMYFVRYALALGALFVVLAGIGWVVSLVSDKPTPVATGVPYSSTPPAPAVPPVVTPSAATFASPADAAVATQASGGVVWRCLLDGVPHYTSRPRPGMTQCRQVAHRSDAAAPAGQAASSGDYVRAERAPNGAEWPTHAGYIDGYERYLTDGHSTVTIDNSSNDSDVFVKLIAFDAGESYPARVFFIPAHGSFTARKLPAGPYDVRYRDLESGALTRSERFTLDEDDTTYSEYSLTLYKVRDGNTQTFPLAESEF